ncbi:MAG: hypothetical protein ACRDSN_00755, partial [Pseudonocardiaceae bacterium]
MSPPDIPRLDQPPPGAEPRTLQFRTQTSVGRRGFFGRRGFLAVLGAGAMTLGITVLGWIPLARPARAEPGTEFLYCGRYGDGSPGGPICVGAPYSPDYCGDDNWFITGCFSGPRGTDCYEPAEICRVTSENGEGRNAWRWEADGVTYRCADGYAFWNGAPNPDVVICSATLTVAPPPPSSSSPPTSPPPSSPPTPPPPSSPPTSPPPSAPPSFPTSLTLPE